MVTIHFHCMKKEWLGYTGTLLCSTEERKSYEFRKALGWVNDGIYDAHPWTWVQMQNAHTLNPVWTAQNIATKFPIQKLEL